MYILKTTVDLLDSDTAKNKYEHQAHNDEQSKKSNKINTIAGMLFYPNHA